MISKDAFEELIDDIAAVSQETVVAYEWGLGTQQSRNDLKRLKGIAIAEHDALRARIAELEAAAAWIPVGERLPVAYDEVVQVLVDRTMMVTAHMEQRGEHFVWCKNYYSGLILPGVVTHWRPLPSAPEAE